MIATILMLIACVPDVDGWGTYRGDWISPVSARTIALRPQQGRSSQQ